MNQIHTLVLSSESNALQHKQCVERKKILNALHCSLGSTICFENCAQWLYQNTRGVRKPFLRQVFFSFHEIVCLNKVAFVLLTEQTQSSCILFIQGKKFCLYEFMWTFVLQSLYCFCFCLFYFVLMWLWHAWKQHILMKNGLGCKICELWCKMA